MVIDSHRDVIFVSFDSVRSDVMLAGDFATLRALASRGALFTNATSSSPLTPVSHASVFTGLYPFHHGIRHLFRERLSPNILTITELFKQRGYATGAFVASAGLNHWYGLSKAFDVYNDEVPPLSDGRHPLDVVDVAARGTAYTKGEVIVDRAVTWLKDARSGDQPLFMFVHFFDAHWPYAPPEPWRSRYSGHLYAGEVAYMDHCLGKLLSHIDPNNSLIVVFSDHGEDLGEHGGVGSDHPHEMGHGTLLFEETTRVFCIFAGNMVPKRQVTDLVRLVDIVPTVLDLLGYQALPNLDGQSVLPLVNGVPPVEPNVAYFETFFPEELKVDDYSYPPLRGVKIQIADHLLKIVWELGNNGHIAVHDLNSDPHERSSVFDRPPLPQ